MWFQKSAVHFGIQACVLWRSFMMICMEAELFINYWLTDPYSEKSVCITTKICSIVKV